MARMQRSLFAQLDALSAELSVKTAGTKKADGPTPADPGGYAGASSHPSASVDNNVQDASTGSRASEYESDIKEQQGAVAVDNTPEMSQEGRQDEVQLNLGTNVSAVGEDPAVEDDYKGTKDDPGTEHPAKTEDGEKYSKVSFKEAKDRCGALGNDILATLLSGSTSLDKQADAAKPAAAVTQPAAGTKEAFAAGYELAATLGLDKEAAEASVREVCASTLRDADVMADLFVGYLYSKQAGADDAEEASEGEDHSAPGDELSGANNGADAAVDGGEAGAPVGGDPAAMGGAPDLGGMGGAPEGGPASDEEAIQELASALEELGIPPEALLQAVQESGAGGGGDPAAMGGAPAAMGGDPAAMGGDPAAAMMGGDPAAAGMPPAEEPKMASAQEVLHALGQEVIMFKRAGRYQVKEARTKRSRELRDQMKQHILELINRN